MNGAVQKHHGAFSETAIEGETVVMHLANGEFFSLTGTAREIWLLIDDQRSMSDIAAQLAARYGGDADPIAADVAQFLAHLTEAGLVRRD